mgnify:CR=1 FL=1
MSTEEVKPPVIFTGNAKAPSLRKLPIPPTGKVTRYILTSAQNNTEMHDKTWANLQALRAHYGAQIFVSRFTYNKASYSSASVKPGTAKASDKAPVSWPDQIKPYIQEEYIELAPGLIWCGNMNILPTAVNPLAGLDAYTGRASSIVPHPKFAMRSVASGKNEATKLMYTTGTVTLRNYIQKKEGMKAEFHHGYGALLVEVDATGSWWVRQLNADSDGTIYDLGVKAESGKVTTDNRIEGVAWGDIHVAQGDHDVNRACWGHTAPSMIDVLKPKHQFMHDLMDFHTRSGHVIKRNLFHDLFRTWAQGHTKVAHEFDGAYRFLEGADRNGCRTHVVMSNHDRFFDEWLHIGDYRKDPGNAILFLEAQLYAYNHMASQPSGPKPKMLEWALRRSHQHAGGEFKRFTKVNFLDLDDSFILCPDANGGIEMAMHGHLGPNGSRGMASNIARMGRKAVIGHSHSAGIYDGVYQTGLTGSMDQGYNSGPSSWTQSHVIVYPNGKRAVITLWGGKWRAE